MDGVLRVVSLCSGGGGLEVGLRRGFARLGIRIKTVCWVERDPGARAVLLSRMDRGEIDNAPLWGDLTTLPTEDWQGIDMVTAGYPCQPFSTQGKRRASDDERWLWDDVWRIVQGTGARIGFFENVASHLHRGKGFDRVLGSIAAAGWRAEWDCIPAAAVGAPQIRDRVFIAAASQATVQGLRAGPGPGPEIENWAPMPDPPYTCRMDEGDPRIIRTRLRVLGNGVVPQAACHAVQVLMPRLLEGSL